MISVDQCSKTLPNHLLRALCVSVVKLTFYLRNGMTIRFGVEAVKIKPRLNIWLVMFLLLQAGVFGEWQAASAASTGLQWHRVSQENIEGQGWKEVKSPFDRFPARAEALVRPRVWEFSRHTSGLNLRFHSDATEIWVRWTLLSDRLAMPHMPATGVSGLDLYAKENGRWYFVGAGIPKSTSVNEVKIVSGLSPSASAKEYRLYLPLYNGISQLEVGIPEGSSLQFLPPSQASPIVFYGTSITQGGCASRPGMSYSALLGRKLNVPIINLGFSGNGKSEPEVAELLAELQPAAFVLDPLGNMETEQVANRLPVFIEILRQRHPSTPILIHENVYYPTTRVVPSRLHRVEASNAVLNKIVKQRNAKGDHNISIIPACDLTVDDGNTTVDGTHPTDLGFLRMADQMEPYLRKFALGATQ